MDGRVLLRARGAVRPLGGPISCVKAGLRSAIYTTAGAEQVPLLASRVNAATLLGPGSFALQVSRADIATGGR